MRKLAPVAVGSAVLALVGWGLHRVGWLPPAGLVFLLVVAALLILAGLVVASAWPRLEVYAPAVVRGPAVGSRVALSFDDGPDPRSTPALLAALEAAGARATFFVLVDRAEQHPELLRAMAASHEIALHGPGHDTGLVFAPPDRGAAALVEAQARIEALCGQRPRWYRPPFGVTSPRLGAALARTDLRLVWCSLRTGDGVGGSVAGLRELCSTALAGDIVLMHEGPRAAREALPVILRDLRARGLEPVTVGALLESSP
jgi:peptidoglycan/xylan/chitin deacetylase (PgdA/CDA1 family)